MTNWIERGNAANERGNLAEALADYQQAANADPAQPVAWYQLALTYRRLGRAAEALAAARKSTAADATFAPGFELVAHLVQDAGDARSALAPANRAVELDARSADYRLRRALVEADLGDTAAELADLNAALAAEPHRLDALHALAALHLRRGETREALAVLGRYLAETSRSATPPQPAVAAAYASLLDDAGRFADALAFLSAQRDDPAFTTPRARALIGLGRRAEAESLLAHSGRDDVDAVRLHGTLLFKDGRYREAADVFRTVVAAAPSDELSLRNLGASYLALGEPASALPVLREAIRLKPEDTLAKRYEADALRGTGDLRGAVSAARDVLALAGDDARLLMMLGIDEYTLGDRDGGYAHYAKGCALLPPDASRDRETCERQLAGMRRARR
ncbi:MAG TPA: tetratricopeptide repeat protein [Candidatus Elarobacter sp.]|nr:tetratricopeptide repeat protein [Candidatus Elarobacter sp.]